MQTFRKQVVAFVFLLLFVPAVFAQNANTLSALKQAVEQTFPKLDTPGLSVAVGAENEILWTDGFGFADVEEKKAATSRTIYRYASISKPISATAIMQLVEAGKVSLDAPIQLYVPTFPKKPEGEITVRHLLTHTSGIRHYRGLEMLNNRRYETVDAALKIFQEDELEFRPGEKYLYSSYAYNILAAVVENESGNNFRAYLKEKIFQPAGMTAADLEFLEEPLENRCRQYVRNNDGFHPAPHVDLSCKWAGGGMAGTAGDLVRFCFALQSGKILEAESCEQMYTPAALADGSRTEYGLGWRVRKDKADRVWVGHSGGATGGTTYFLHNPQERVAVALLANAQGVKGLDELALKLGNIVVLTEKTAVPAPAANQ